MSNPFEQGLLFHSHETDLDQLGRRQMRKTLDDYCWNHHPIPSYAIYGPRGSGKTTILERYFTPERRRALALERKNLVVLRTFSDRDLTDNASIYKFFVEAVLESLENLRAGAPEDYCLLKSELERHVERYPSYRIDDEQGRELLRVCVAELRSDPFDYCLTLVIDNFHQLTNSTICAQATFQNLASLAQNRLISYIIATDLHMKIASEAFHISEFERIFNNTPIPISPLKKKYLTALIEDLLEDADEEELLSGDDLEKLCSVTGGIPGLLREAGYELCQYRLEDDRELTESEIMDVCRAACEAGAMGGWVKCLPQPCWTALEMIAAGASDEDFEAAPKEVSDARNVLSQSGLVTKSYVRRTWSPVCPLFAAYLSYEIPRQKERFASLRREEEERLRREQEASQSHTTIIHVAGDYVSGDKQEQNVHNTVSFNGLTTGELLDLLDNGQLLAARLQEAFQDRPIPRLEIPEDATEEQIVQIYDETAEQVGVTLIADAEPTEEEEKTLDVRFLSVRDRTRSAVTDELLESLSPKCQFYLKIAVVVEDALAVLKDFRLGDFSAQAIMYAKVLEQRLRDTMFPLFSEHTELRHWDTYLRQENVGGKDTFAMKDVSKAMIGAFQKMLDQKSGALAGLCLQYRKGFAPGSPAAGRDLQAWENWWWNLAGDVEQARIYRNDTGHAGSETQESAAEALCDLLLGKGSILKRCRICARVYESYQREKRADNVSYAEGVALVGQDVTFSCLEVTKSGGLKGALTGWGYRAAISPKKAKVLGGEELIGTEIPASVVEFDLQTRTFRLSPK